MMTGFSRKYTVIFQNPRSKVPASTATRVTPQSGFHLQRDTDGTSQLSLTVDGAKG